MAVSFDVCVRGSGIVAHALALQLAAQRLRVALQRMPDTARPAEHMDVRAYALNAASRRLLEGLRCWPQASQATPVLDMFVHGDQGGALHFDAQAVGADALNWIVDAPALAELLANAVQFQPQVQVVETTVSATLTAVCEGRDSASCAAFGVEMDAHTYDQTAIAARVSCEQPHQQRAFQWFAEGEVLALLPLDGEAGSSMAVVWSLANARAQELLGAAPDVFCEALRIASHNALGAFALTSQRQAWPLQVASARHWSGRLATGGWVLAGDAAHTVHPLAGQGLNLGLADAAELARVLDKRPYWRAVDDPRLLRSYERARKAALAAVGGTGDGLQRLFAHNHAGVQTLRNWGMQRFERSGPLKDWVARRAMDL